MATSRAAAVTLAALLVLGVTACSGGSDQLDEPGAVPAPRLGAGEPVHPCALVDREQAGDLLGGRLGVVGLAYTASAVPTLQCQLGARFGEPALTVGLTTQPIARLVFDEAYGDPAGGEPRRLRGLGQAAYMRTETDAISLRVLESGSVVTLDLHADPAVTAAGRLLRQLADQALATLPRNPTLAPAPAGSRCGRVPARVVTAAVGLPPALASQLLGANGQVMCSWAGLPGSAVVTVQHDATKVARLRRDVVPLALARVDGIADLPEGAAVSDPDRAGDLMLMVDDSTLVTIVVEPTAGFADDEVATTAAEKRLAASVVGRLL